ncbi:MAG: hypothetical protein FJZ95_04150 [Chloroflexi bacterium]|nr:hypothetical protein [Chloroflexota bacterium]
MSTVGVGVGVGSTVGGGVGVGFGVWVGSTVGVGSAVGDGEGLGLVADGVVGSVVFGVSLSSSSPPPQAATATTSRVAITMNDRSFFINGFPPPNLKLLCSNELPGQGLVGASA